MISHDEFRRRLLGIFPSNPKQPQDRGVALVARLQNAQLQLPGRRAHIFIPDLHLLNQEDAKAYPKYHFVQDADLRLFLKKLSTMKRRKRGELAVWHLGDLFDVWRARGGRGPKEEVDEIAADHSEILGLLVDPPPRGCRAEILAGNHDYVLHALQEWRAPRFYIISNEDRGGGDVLVLHGDVFSWVERTLPEDLQAAVVRLATWISSGQHRLHQEDKVVAAINRNLKTGDEPIGMPQARLPKNQPIAHIKHNTSVNVIDGDRGKERAPNKRFFAAAKALALELKKHGHNIRVMVIGHTHWSRLVAGNRGDGDPFVLMDCGAWFGRCRLGPKGPWIWSAQIGVLIQNDLRLYQLGWRRAN